MKAFKVTGKFQMGTRIVDFSKEVIAKTKDDALEKIYSEIGSNHRTKRKKIDINDIVQIKQEELTNVFLKEMMVAENE